MPIAEAVGVRKVLEKLKVFDIPKGRPCTVHYACQSITLVSLVISLVLPWFPWLRGILLYIIPNWYHIFLNKDYYSRFHSYFTVSKLDNKINSIIFQFCIADQIRQDTGKQFEPIRYGPLLIRISTEAAPWLKYDSFLDWPLNHKCHFKPNY